MDNQLDLDIGTYGYRISNPPIFLITGILGFLKIYEKTSMEKLRQKSLKLTGYLEFLINYQLKKLTNKKLKCEIMTPKNPEKRGCQLSLKFNFDICQVYKELVKHGVAVDKRFPNVIRVAPVHFYNNFTDVWRFVQVLVESIEEIEKNGQ
uniref:Kynureninase n=1 Tax=Panagrolaimus sp. JU765 TaxID=591449 RepID=A0AC34QUD6_9BILA